MVALLPVGSAGIREYAHIAVARFNSILPGEFYPGLTLGIAQTITALTHDLSGLPATGNKVPLGLGTAKAAVIVFDGLGEGAVLLAIAVTGHHFQQWLSLVGVIAGRQGLVAQQRGWSLR